MEKTRLDMLLVKRGFFLSRATAKAAILSGDISINGEKVDKAGTLVSGNSKIDIKRRPSYVSRGGLKLEKAVKYFKVNLKGKIALDVGASTGGFTDCLLKCGVKKVITVDVGYGQLAWRLRKDNRVHVLERTNVRYLKPNRIPELADVVVVDVSFISLRKIQDNLKKLVKKPAQLLVLIKPQFEAEKKQVGKKGVVRKPAVHKSVLTDLLAYLESQGFSIEGLTFSPILGPEGNIEFWAYLAVDGQAEPLQEGEIARLVDKLVEEAHRELLKK